MSNIDQHWDPERYRRDAAFVPRLGEPVLELLAPRAGERILDVGCGEGTLTARIATETEVVGIDASTEQVEAARARGLDARVLAAEAMAFDREFDAVFSNAALHWMLDQDRVLANIRRALKPGGRFVAEMGAEGNVALVLDTLLDELDRRGLNGGTRWPWIFPSEAQYRRLLLAAGLVPEQMIVFERPTPLPSGIASWIETFAQPLLVLLPEEHRAQCLDAVEARLAPRLRDAGGRWTADYVRLRFLARAS